MRLDDAALDGRLASEPLRKGEVRRFRGRIEERLEDARNDSNHNPTRLEQAYHAILDCALLALRISGYRVKATPGHHDTVIRSLEETLGASRADASYFLDLADLRRHDLYDAAPIPDTTVAEAVQAAAALVDRLDAWFEGRDDQKS